MKRGTKNQLDNSHTTKYQSTQKELFDSIENTPVGEFMKIEYRKIPNINDRDTIVEEAFSKINHMDLAELSEGKHKKVIKHALNTYKGELKVVYYKRTETLRDESGYLMFQDDKNDWKKVDIRNVISVTNSDGVMRTRNEQR